MVLGTELLCSHWIQSQRLIHVSVTDWLQVVDSANQYASGWASEELNITLAGNIG